MKKLSLLLAVIIFSAMLDASESEVINTYKEYSEAVIALDLPKAVSYLDPAYSDTSSRGKVTTYADIQNMLPVFRGIKKVIASEATLLDIVEVSMAYRGTPLTEEMRKQIKAMENSEEGKRWLANIKSVFDILMTEIKNEQSKMRTAWATFKVVSCEVSGDSAVLIYDIKSIHADYMERRTNDFIKTNGKWRLKKSVAKKITAALPEKK